MIFRLISSTDLPDVIDLWREAFGDSEKAIRFFFESFPDCISYAAEEDGQVVSMVHGLPQTLSPDVPAAYLYAVATRKSHRGRGLCRKLMAFAEADLASRGVACCMLTPGEPELFRFYTRLGYAAAFTRNRTAFSGGECISAAEYIRLRERVLDRSHVVYDLRTMAYAQQVYGLTFYRTADGCAAAGEDYTAEVLPQDLGGTPFAMIKWLSESRPLRNAYLGLALE